MRLWLLGHADRSNFVRATLHLPRNEPVPAAVADFTSPTFVERGPRNSGCAGTLVLVFVLIGGLLSLVWATIRTLWGAAFATPSPTDAMAALVLLLVVAITIAAAAIAARPIPLPDPEFAMRRALELLDSRPKEGRVMLRALVHASGDPRARRALVEDARRRGLPAEAGRWGSPVAGLTTDAERDAYAVSILHRGKDAATLLAERSSLRYDDPVPGDIADVARRLRTPPWDPLGARVPPPRPRAWWWWAATAPLPIGASAIAFAPESARIIAIVSVITVLATWCGLSVRAAVSSTREHRERWAFALTALALVAAAAGVVLAAAR
ncbi:hypothetical protein SRABI128_01166 [Microbacterium sp. Bi128]|nr:hypothetical protein SRABI128_01166 [Microbacterium sp. Bi128]